MSKEEEEEEEEEMKENCERTRGEGIEIRERWKEKQDGMYIKLSL